MLRGIQPTIRLAVSDFCGIWQVTVCRVAQTLNPGTYACHGSSDNWNPRGRSGGVMAPLPCPLRRVVPKHKSQMPATSRRPPLAARPSKDGRLQLTSGHCSPESGTSTINSRLPKNVITGRLRTSQFCTALSGACSPFVLSACPFTRKTVKRFCRELWRLSTWRQNYLHRGWPGKPAIPGNSSF